ncbi:cotranscriptional regulator ARB2A isoform X2 [Chroicocephalus ridibundus]|uniref:cotranscriptional regulator ARB2A isoform X2 n=1 Tax=Chroicocephalus ridibundus TaxID=1192867 RepID=UPI002FDCD657
MAQLPQGGPDEKEKTTALKDLLSRIDLDELMKKDEPPLEFPDTLEGFEYVFNEKGQLRHIKTGEPFVFNYREDLHRWNQKRYEALGEIITKYVYELLQKECHLKKVTLPVDATESEPKSFIFISEDALTNPDKLLVLIHGSGVVRAGQWARRLIINEDLDSGTQIPYIKRAIEEGYGVIVLNPNENYIEVEKTKAQVQLSSDGSDEPAEKRERKDKIQKETKKRRDFYEKYRNPQKEKETMQVYIRDNGSPEEHAIYVWDHFISQSAAENVLFVAHSYGGLAFVELCCEIPPGRSPPSPLQRSPAHRFVTAQGSQRKPGAPVFSREDQQNLKAMAVRGPFQPNTFCDSMILCGTGLNGGAFFFTNLQWLNLVFLAAFVSP